MSVDETCDCYILLGCQRHCQSQSVSVTDTAEIVYSVMRYFYVAVHNCWYQELTFTGSNSLAHWSIRWGFGQTNWANWGRSQTVKVTNSSDVVRKSILKNFSKSLALPESLCVKISTSSAGFACYFPCQLKCHQHNPKPTGFENFNVKSKSKAPGSLGNRSWNTSVTLHIYKIENGRKYQSQPGWSRTFES